MKYLILDSTAWIVFLLCNYIEALIPLNDAPTEEKTKGAQKSKKIITIVMTLMRLITELSSKEVECSSLGFNRMLLIAITFIAIINYEIKLECKQTIKCIQDIRIIKTLMTTTRTIVISIMHIERSMNILSLEKRDSMKIKIM